MKERYQKRVHLTTCVMFSSERLVDTLTKKGVMGRLNGLDDAEKAYRRQLLLDAREGKAGAKDELEREFHVRTYPAAERAKLHYEVMPTKKRNDYEPGR
jgi:hypothetical protein